MSPKPTKPVESCCEKCETMQEARRTDPLSCLDKDCKCHSTKPSECKKCFRGEDRERLCDPECNCLNCHTVKPSESWEIEMARKFWPASLQSLYVSVIPIDIVNFIRQLLSAQAEEIIKKMKIEGEMGKLTPFQQTVNTYIENRGQEILAQQKIKGI